jgi:hypothetical protein
MLVIPEYELMQTENLLADYMNVPVTPAEILLFSKAEEV